MPMINTLEIKSGIGHAEIYADGKQITGVRSFEVSQSFGDELPKVVLEMICHDIIFTAEKADVEQKGEQNDIYDT